MKRIDRRHNIPMCIIMAALLTICFLFPRIAHAQLSDEDQIRANWAAVINALNNKDIDTLMSYFSLSYLKEGRTYDITRAEMLSEFSDPAFQPIAYEIVSISINGNNATMLVNMSDGPDTVKPETEYLLKEGDSVWRMYGNQELYELQANSIHWAAGYYANIWIHDPSHAITAASASGPGITGTASLTYGGADWGFFTGSPFVGVSVPGTSQTYTINFTDGTGFHSVQRAVTGYVTQFASNLLPLGNVEGPIIFSWTGIPGATGYSVQVGDASNNNRIWNQYDLPANTTSTPYTGPALAYGQTYAYFVESRVWTAGTDNSSMAVGQFTYGTFSISGMVKNFATTLGLQGVTIAAINNATDAIVATVQTDTSGNYIVSLPAAGSYRITATKTRYELVSGPLNPLTLTNVTRTAVADIIFLTPSGITQINLSTDWNFISFPRLPATKTVEQAILAGVLAHVRIIWTWDSATQQWKRWRPTGGANNTLTEFAFGKGYWMFMDAVGAIDLSTWDLPETTPVHLDGGWNLIGYVGEDGRALTDCIASLDNRWTAIWNWTAGHWYGKHWLLPVLSAPMQPLTTLNEGKAYWIKIRPGAGPMDWVQ